MTRNAKFWGRVLAEGVGFAAFLFVLYGVVAITFYVMQGV